MDSVVQDRPVATLQPPFAARYDNFIGGAWVAPREGRYFQNVSPITGKAVGEIARSQAEDIEAALDAAHKAKDAWGRTSVAERAAILLRIACLLYTSPSPRDQRGSRMPSSA